MTLFGERMSLDHGGHRGGLPRNAEENRRDGTAGDPPAVGGHEHAEGRHRRECIGERQKQDDAHGRADSRKGARQQPPEASQTYRQDVLREKDGCKGIPVMIQHRIAPLRLPSNNVTQLQSARRKARVANKKDG